MPKSKMPGDATVAGRRIAPLLAGIDRSAGQGPSGTCHEWTRARRADYGLFWSGSRTVAVHRAVVGLFAKVNGVVVAHRCDNPACARLDHLFLTDMAGNNADRDAKGRRVSLHGASNPNAKLTNKDVAAIRAAPATMTYAQIGRRYGVQAAAVGTIRRREHWRHL